ncbi:hypothetical protein [Helicobacter pylori]|nr:hypothetical protein [Helicobacter pylori]MBM0620486.1 hypothetical protein [Helicobacter pylori]MUT42249.1 hypothetical protein [Helicobacter pylori]MUT74240.1 hypothetical protein [Helicobacter pylori]MUT82039.1 hypothetical protein [Helicobacter pylori]WQW54760.1 hypothetical protein KVM78_05135 [Helicobacter pylori]
MSSDSVCRLVEKYNDKIKEVLNDELTYYLNKTIKEWVYNINYELEKVEKNLKAKQE